MSFTPGAGTRFLLFGSQPLSGGTISGNSSSSFLDISGTWNTTGTPTGIKLNVTDTASAAGALLMDLRVGGASRVRVFKDGGAVLAYITGSNWSVDANTLSIGSASGSIVLGADAVLTRDAANTLAQRNGVNAQTFRLYNTYTDASNYERGFARWNSNVFEIGAERAGTGSVRDLRIASASGTNINLPGGNSGIGIGQSSEGNNRFSVALNAAFNGQQVNMLSGTTLNWSSSALNAWSVDTGLARAGAAIVVFTDGASGGGAIQMIERAAPAAPAANNVVIYAEDNGAGKTRLMARFATGAAQQIAIEP